MILTIASNRRVLMVPLLLLSISVLAARVRTTVEQVDDRMNIAILQPAHLAGVSESEVGLIADRLRVELFSTGRVNVMEREEMTSILREQGFQQSGACSEETCVAEAGQLLGVEAIIGGTIGRLGSVYLINLRVIDVATGKLIAAVSRDIKGDIEQIIGLLRDIALEVATRLSGDTPPAVSYEKPGEIRYGYSPGSVESVTELSPKKQNPNRSGLRLLAGTHWGATR